MQHHSESGYLLITAIIIIVLVSFLAITVSQLMLTETHTSAMDVDQTETLAISRSGLEMSAQRLLTSDLSRRVQCGNVADFQGFFTNIALFNLGLFTVTSVQHYVGSSDVGAASVLSDNISDTDLLVPLQDITPYLNRGRVVIERESIDYAATSNDSTLCQGLQPCLLAIARGVGGTLAKSHVAGAIVSQNSCLLTSQSAIPDFSVPLSRRSSIGEIKQLEEGWAGGSALFRWQGKEWSDFIDPMSFTVNALSILSYAEGWMAGGTPSSGGVGFWDGAAWNFTVLGSQTLLGLSCPWHQQCYTVGQGNTAWYLDNLGWHAEILPVVSTPLIQPTLKSIFCDDLNFCKAVGYQTDSTVLPVTIQSLFLQKTGSWNFYTDPSFQVSLNGIFCTADGVCHVVGDQGTFLQWVGNIPPVAEAKDPLIIASVNSVDCVEKSVNDYACFAVGGAGLLAQWSQDNPTWVVSASDGSMSGENFTAVACADLNHCWAVSDAGTLAHWDGNQWSHFYTFSGQSFYAIQETADHSQQFFPWHEVFNF